MPSKNVELRSSVFSRGIKYYGADLSLDCSTANNDVVQINEYPVKSLDVVSSVGITYA